MISANVIKGVHELLEERGVRLKSGDTFGDRVARTLHISGEQTEMLLEKLHDGATLDEAAAKAKIDVAEEHRDTLTAIAQAIGEALGRLRARV